jgi:hypothetical protein
MRGDGKLMIRHTTTRRRKILTVAAAAAIALPIPGTARANGRCGLLQCEGFVQSTIKSKNNSQGVRSSFSTRTGGTGQLGRRENSVEMSYDNFNYLGTGWFDESGNSFTQTWFDMLVVSGQRIQKKGNGIAGSHTYEVSHHPTSHDWQVFLDGVMVHDIPNSTFGYGSLHPLTNVMTTVTGDWFAQMPRFGNLKYAGSLRQTWYSWLQNPAATWYDNDEIYANHCLAGDTVEVWEGSATC